MSPVQSAMARAALSISRDELARLAKLGGSTVVRFESGNPVSQDSVAAMRLALENAGVEFIDAGSIIRSATTGGGAGVRLRN